VLRHTCRHRRPFSCIYLTCISTGLQHASTYGAALCLALRRVAATESDVNAALVCRMDSALNLFHRKAVRHHDVLTDSAVVSRISDKTYFGLSDDSLSPRTGKRVSLSTLSNKSFREGIVKHLRRTFCKLGQSASRWLTVKPRLHDTTSCQTRCQTGCQTGLTNGCIV